jgi:hypothetical protein
LGKSKPHWRLKDGENFTKIFYNRQRECPKTSTGKQICMKFFICGIWDSSCNRAHLLSKEDATNFEGFIEDCHLGASKPDFKYVAEHLHLPHCLCLHLQ